MDSCSDSDIRLAKIIYGNRSTPIFSSDSDIPLARITHGSRATPIFSSDSGIPLAKTTHGSRATPIPICNRKRPSLAKLATAGSNLFYCIGKSYFNPFKGGDCWFFEPRGHFGKWTYLSRNEEIIPYPEINQSQPSEKNTSGKLTGGNPTLIQTTTNSSTEVIVIPEIPQKSSQDSSLPEPSSSGSALEPILLDSTPEETHPVATQPRSTIRPPTFLCWSPSGFLIPLAKLGYVQISRKSSIGNSPIKVAEQDSGSEILSTINQGVQQALEEFDADAFVQMPPSWLLDVWKQIFVKWHKK